MKAPDMYMEKHSVNYAAKGVIDLNLSLEENLKQVAQALNKPIENLTVITLAKPPSRQAIAVRYGTRVFAIPDGDVAAHKGHKQRTESEVDVMYCVGGAPENVISAAVIRALGGDMQGRLILRHQAR